MPRLLLGLVVLPLGACGGGSSSTDAVADPALADGPVAPRMVLDLGFEGALPAEVNPGTGTLTPSEGFAPLGPVGNTFGPTFLRSPTGNTVIVTSGLPAHETLSLSFLFAAIDSLDGTGSFPAGDFFRVTLDGEEIFYESFANATPDKIQSYVAPEGGELARHEDLGFGGPGSYYTDSAYDMGVEPRFMNLSHTAPTAVIEFTLVGEGVQALDDESWAIDNLRVTVAP